MSPAARLRRSTDIAAVRASGRSRRGTAFNAKSRPNGAQSTRLAVIAPRAVGSAVKRNRARRRVREAFRRGFASAPLGPSIDLLITVQPGAQRADFKALEAEAASLLRELAR
ncbi:MAG TPA: ribonuclease P protein component [Candidatus Limnocylindrales bacterium]|nr:ribonuclease P protein component [Candidatus Limnocylindrales bacterium]